MIAHTFGEDRILKPQISKLRDAHTPSIGLEPDTNLANYFSSLKRLCLGDHLPNFAVENCLEPPAQLLLNDDEEVLNYACCALSYISSVSKDQTDTIMKTGAFPCLLELVSHHSPKLHEPALLIIE